MHCSVANWHFKYLLKSDDDTFLNAPLIERELERLSKQLLTSRSWWAK